MSAAFEAALETASTGSAPDTIALMRVLMEASSPEAAREGLAGERVRHRANPRVAARLGRLQALWSAHPEAWTTVRAVVGAVAHDWQHGTPEDTLAYLADTFDRLVATSPEGSVALYSLGSPDLLAAATAEVVERMAEWGLLGPDRDGLDFGCGIGRFLQALAPRLRSITGLDLSAGMVAEAARRCRALPNVAVRQNNGRDLAGLPNASFDLVLAADVFPYLVQAGGDLPARHLAEFARVLRVGGTALILNYSYRGDAAADGQDVRRLASTAKLVEVDSGPTSFTTWDAAVYRLRKSP